MAYKRIQPITLPSIYCDRPKDGESLSSWLDRNIQRYGQSRRGVISLLGENHQKSWDFDAFNMWPVRAKLFRATGLTWPDLAGYAVSPVEQDWLLLPNIRSLYCPRCFAEDLSSMRVPYFRLDWARIFLTHCPTHRTPLVSWKDILPDGSRVLPHEWLKEIGEHSKVLAPLAKDLKVIDKFEKDLSSCARSMEIWSTLTTFERACLDYAMYRRRGSVTEQQNYDMGSVCRLLVLVLKQRREKKRMRSVCIELCPAFVQESVLSCAWGQKINPDVQRAWQWGVRAMTNLPARRAALWIVAHTFSHLSGRTKLRSGATAPAGHTPGWLEMMSSAYGSREAIKGAFRPQQSNHLLQPKNFSISSDRVPPFWPTDVSA